jgi:hypothetical protein
MIDPAISSSDMLSVIYFISSAIGDVFTVFRSIDFGLFTFMDFIIACWLFDMIIEFLVTLYHIQQGS